MTQLSYLLIFGPAAGYLLGSIPFGLLIGLSKGVDIRKVGSGNIGATNLGRTLGPKFFWYAFVLDALKGFVPTLVVSLLARAWNLPEWVALPTGLATLCGHIFPLYLKFKGGKGVATSFGVVLGIWPIFTIAGAAAGAVFCVVLMMFRYISVASITATILFAVFVAVLGLCEASPLWQPWTQFRYMLLAAILLPTLIIVKHRTNIRRLIAGTEPKIGQKKEGRHEGT